MMKARHSLLKCIKIMNIAKIQMDEFKDKMSFRLFGRYRSVALFENTCVNCGESKGEFKDEISVREYQLSALCQKCQDKTFG